MITQLSNYKDNVIKEVQPAAPYEPDTDDVDKDNGQQLGPGKFVRLNRYTIFPYRRLHSREEVDGYLEGVRFVLYESLNDNDGILIN